MKFYSSTRFITALFFLASLIMLHPATAGKQVNYPAPEFTHQKTAEWINSKPLSIEEMRGKVMLYDFWTFDCWNCYRSFDWLHSVEEKYKDKAFTVIGIHTPEFQHERNPRRVREKVKGFGFLHPVMLDNDFSYWNAMKTRYWPTFYLIDKKGYVRAVYIGETHQDDKNAKEIEQLIETLLAE